MNWITKKLTFLSQKIKNVIRKRPSKEEIENSEWTACCKGPILKKELEENMWVCPYCNKHHRINCRQRFDIFFGKNNYQILETPIPADDPLNIFCISALPRTVSLMSGSKRPDKDFST